MTKEFEDRGNTYTIHESKDIGEHSTLQNEAGIKTSWWGTLLKKNTFKWMVTKYNSEKDG